jgi:hypothetical protein
LANSSGNPATACYRSHSLGSWSGPTRH